MNSDDKLLAMCVWGATASGFSVYILTGGFFKGLVVFIFFLFTCLVGVGTRWLLRLAFVVSIVALGVLVEVLPERAQWPNLTNLARQLPENVSAVTAAIRGKSVDRIETSKTKNE